MVKSSEKQACRICKVRWVERESKYPTSIDLLLRFVDARLCKRKRNDHSWAQAVLEEGQNNAQPKNDKLFWLTAFLVLREIQAQRLERLSGSGLQTPYAKLVSCDLALAGLKSRRPGGFAIQQRDPSVTTSPV
jgi:hypothetical protein